MLNRLYHESTREQRALLVVHGLYGSARNWGVICKRLSDERPIIAVDQRNHGDSPWFATHGYEDMARDLADVIQAHGAPVDVLGHSMGGKAAMVLALRHPELVNRMIVADIAPVTYGHDQSQYIQAMQALDLSKIEKRSQAMDALEAFIDDPTLRSFFTQSLDIKGKRWKLNLDVLRQDMDKILGFPEISGPFAGDVLFLSGANSHYVQTEHRPLIKAKFPNARFAKIPGAGHWLHAEKPREFEATVRAYLAQA